VFYLFVFDLCVFFAVYVFSCLLVRFVCLFVCVLVWLFVCLITWLCDCLFVCFTAWLNECCRVGGMSRRLVVVGRRQGRRHEPKACTEGCKIRGSGPKHMCIYIYNRHLQLLNSPPPSVDITCVCYLFVLIMFCICSQGTYTKQTFKTTNK